MSKTIPETLAIPLQISIEDIILQQYFNMHSAALFWGKQVATLIHLGINDIPTSWADGNVDTDPFTGSTVKTIKNKLFDTVTL